MEVPKEENLKKVNEFLWEIPKDFRFDMKVPARLYITEEMKSELFEDRSLWQLVNLTTLPGVVKYAIAMPDVHEGYGSPIGGVVAVRTDEGIISPGMIGYDINCGVRLLRSNLNYRDIESQLDELATTMYGQVPSGLGRGGRMKLEETELDKVLTNGASYMVEHGFGDEKDLEFIESNGKLEVADPSLVSSKAKKRGRDQSGTLGSGNHFVEIQKVDQVYDEDAAKAFGLHKDQVCIMIHTGSRGLGHQIATDYIRLFLKSMPKYDITLPDRELAAVPFKSDEGQKYFKAMSCGANFAWANRQLITHQVRHAWKLAEMPVELDVVYDIAHNMGKLEKHLDEKGNEVEMIVHRKGATRAFGPGSPGLPEKYAAVGQPVLIPGSMGTASYILAGTEQTMEETFGSSCHGAGRRMSRGQAKREVRGDELKKELEGRGIRIRAGSMAGLAEEAPLAYKDVDSVVNVVHGANIAKKVVRLVPLAVVKG
jgi:tRNA-splicing ligase RtcB